MSPDPVLIAGDPKSTFDLKTTLPTTLKPGGTFKVDPSGSLLPAGMTLTADGLLAVGSASIGSYAGVIFSYTEPA